MTNYLQKTELNEKERGYSAETCVKLDDVEVSSVVQKDNCCVTPVSYTHLDVYKRQIAYTEVHLKHTFFQYTIELF